MPQTRIPSPARSQSGIATPKRRSKHTSRSLCSPALSTASGRLTSLIDQFKDKNMESFVLSPMNERSVLNDNTEIEEPRRKSWWKKLDENSQEVMEVLEDNKLTDANNVIEEFIDIEVLSQEKKNYTLDLPESSDNESINSIVLPQRKLFTQKENQPQKKYGHLIDNRESLAKLHKPNTTNTEKAVNVGTRELFQNKRSKPIFPAALLNISPNKTAADKTKENVLQEPKPLVRNIFGNRPANKRKNMFADFIVSESEDEIPDIQPQVFGFQREKQKRISSVSKGRDGSPTSSITTDLEMEDWQHLPSSTMLENQLEVMNAGTPLKRARLSKLSEAKESDIATINTLQTNTTGETKMSNKSISSKNKSKMSPEIKNKSLNSSRTTRSMLKNASQVEENANTSKQQTRSNKSESKISSKDNKVDVSLSQGKQNTSLNRSQKQNKSKAINTSKAADNETDSEENVANVKVINNLTRTINKSSTKNISNRSVNEKERTVTIKVHDKINKSSSKVIEDEQDDDEHNFSLQYENDDNEVIEKPVLQDGHDQSTNEKNKTKNQSTVLEKDSQKLELNNSKSKRGSINKSIQKEIKEVKIFKESVESQVAQPADDNVDGKVEQEAVIQNLDNEHKKMDNSKINNRDDKNISQENEDKAYESENNHEGNIIQEIEDEQNESSKAADESQEVDSENEEDEEEGNASEGNGEEANESHDNEEKEKSVDESQEVEAEVTESQEIDGEANESQEIEEEANESQEIEEEANESQDVEEEAEESQVVEDDEAPDEESDEEVNEDEEEEANESQVNESSVNASQEVENDEESEQVESEAEVDESQIIEEDQEMEDSDEADKAIASNPEVSDQDDNLADEMEVDDDDENEQESEQVDDNEHNQEENNEEGQIEENNEAEPSAEEIQESPDVTHDTTGRHRQKNINKSPEAILHDKTNQMNSFIAKGRNTSVRKTKSMIKNLNIRPSLAPPRDSTGFSDGTRNSSAEGSGWDSHRTTRKTLRQTFGKDFTPRKSLRALVMEKSAKRQTEQIDFGSETAKFPLANSTKLPEESTHHVDDVLEVSDHDASRRTRQTTLEMYLQKIKQQNIEKKLKMEEAVRNSLKAPVRDTLSLFKVPTKPAPRRPKPTQNKPKKQIKSMINFDELPSEMIEDMKYKPPKRFRPSNASWITKRLYKFLETKLEPKYDYKARVRAEKLVETIYHFAKDLRRHDIAPTDAVEVLKQELARLEVVRTHFEFYEFFHEFMPREVRVKVVPDIVNKISLPRHGVFSDILRGTTVKG